MPASDDPRVVLARRLRALREEHWPDRKITQSQLAQAIGASAPLISSWESLTNPVAPPARRMRAYALFFATERSIAREPFRLPSEAHLTDVERVRRDELLQELETLRRAAIGYEPFSGDTVWHFPAEQVVTIVGSELPARLRESVPYTDPDSPDHVEMYRYSDLDALFELYGHIRAVNPSSQVNIRTANELTPDDYTSNLVLLGGVDWNTVTAAVVDRVDLPVRQEGREVTEPGGFEVEEKGERRMFQPVLRKSGGRDVLMEDIAHFYRALSPFNVKRTITMCNGMFQRGTLGAVRTLTDARFRDRNNDYIKRRFPNQDSFSILFRVLIVNGKVVTPDWTLPDIRLHEWPPEAP